LSDDERPAPRVSAVVLGYRSEPWLERSVHALLGSEGVAVDVVVVDNGCTDGAVERLRGTAGVTIVGDGTNLGFSGGCNLGVSVARGPFVALVNGDLVVEPETMARLVAVAQDPSIGVAAGSVRLAEDPELLNSAGNEIHFLGFSWTGGFRERAADRAIARDVAGAMGALVVLRREVWERLGGFDAHYFAFHEDAELSWRCWQTGLRVRYVPQAVGVHRYEFDRIEQKLYLAERNRLAFVLTLWEARTLAVLAPAFLAVELGVTAVAWRGGWLRQKVDGWRWLLRHRRWLRERRRLLQAERTVSDRALARLMTGRLDAGNFPLPQRLRPADSALAWYWVAARRLLR
jgi:GT2 family glycosyltransferase